MKLMKTVAFIFVSIYSMSCVHAVFFVRLDVLLTHGAITTQ